METAEDDTRKKRGGLSMFGALLCVLYGLSAIFILFAFVDSFQSTYGSNSVGRGATAALGVSITCLLPTLALSLAVSLFSKYRAKKKEMVSTMRALMSGVFLLLLLLSIVGCNSGDHCNHHCGKCPTRGGAYCIGSVGNTCYYCPSGTSCTHDGSGRCSSGLGGTSEPLVSVPMPEGGTLNSVDETVVPMTDDAHP